MEDAGLSGQESCRQPLRRAFPDGASGKEHSCQCRRHKRCRYDPWVRKIPCRRAWQPTPVFLRGGSHAQRSLEGYSPVGRKESDTTEATEHARTEEMSPADAGQVGEHMASSEASSDTCLLVVRAQRRQTHGESKSPPHKRCPPPSTPKADMTNASQH